MEKYAEIKNEMLLLIWDVGGGFQSKKTIIKKLQDKVFSKIEIENFTGVCDHLRVIINEHPRLEKEIFEEALEIFLRKFFELEELL